MKYKIHHHQLHLARKNICVFCIYLTTNRVPSYVLAQIRALDNCGYDTIVVSHSPLISEDISLLSTCCISVTERENIGYDFFAWKFGMDLCEDSAEIENLLLLNDSIIGPFHPVDNIFTEMKSKYDFWGLTDNDEFKYHIQSYFLHANKKVLASDAWRQFWSELKVLDEKLEIVKNFEIELTQVLLQDESLNVGSWIASQSLLELKNQKDYVGFPKAEFWTGVSNVTIRHWKELIEKYEFPYIKKNLFFDKEHYHVVTGGKLYVYNVAPVSWKETIMSRYGFEACKMVEDFLDLFYSTRENSATCVPSGYRILIACREFESIQQIDYVERLLRYFNRMDITAFLVVEQKGKYFNKRMASSLGSFARLACFFDMTADEVEEHRCQLSKERIGFVFSLEIASVRFGNSFLYTGAKPALIVTRRPDAKEIGKFQRIASVGLTSVVAGNHDCAEWYWSNGLKPVFFDPIVSPAVRNINQFGLGHSGVKTYTNSLTFGFSGFDELEDQCHHALAVIKRLMESSSQSYRFILFIEKEQENEVAKRIREYGADLTELYVSGRLRLYTEGSTTWSESEEDPICGMISYYSGTQICSYQYICVRRQVPLFIIRSRIESGGHLQEPLSNTSFDYFGVDRLILSISDVCKDSEIRQNWIRDRIDHFEHQLTGNCSSETFKNLITSVWLDFTELRALLPKVTVIFHFHLYSFDRAGFIYYKNKLREFADSNVDFIFSITSESHEIVKCANDLKSTFNRSKVLVVPNKGRDIGAKFILFDYYLRFGGDSEYVVVLHDKRSLHLPFGEAKIWIDSLLRIIDPSNTRSILNKFLQSPEIGIVGSQERIVDCILRWEQKGAVAVPVFEWNNDLLHGMIDSLELNVSDYSFVGGTMFWIRKSLLKEIDQRFNFLEKYMELEEGNVMDNNGSTITHSWERLLCWAASDLGYKLTGI
jgi:rhamnosyltransferase